MKSFIRKIFEKEVDEQVHRQFVRFGRGEFKKKAALNLIKSFSIKARGSFEYANDFVSLLADFPVKFSGIILSKEQIPELGQAKKKSELFVYDVSCDSEVIRKIKDKAYIMLLDGEGERLSLKMKKKLPKPGKGGEAKVDDKFCQLEADLKYWPKIKEAFFWDLDGKKAQVTHDFLINEIVLPKGEKDFEKIRLLARRAGKIVRNLVVDGKESSREESFEA